MALGAGAIVFAMWITLDRINRLSPAAESAAFAHASFAARCVWIVFRLLGAIVTVPIAEELAFRGFLLRRLANANFETVPCTKFPWMPFLVSSLAFGLLHGERWIEGTIAGMIYALTMLRRGRIADAMAAHALTNALLGVWVMVTGNYREW